MENPVWDSRAPIVADDQPDSSSSSSSSTQPAEQQQLQQHWPNQYEARFGVRIAAETGIALGFRTPHTPRIVDFHTPRYITLQYSATFVFATKSAHLYCLNRVSQSGS